MANGAAPDFVARLRVPLLAGAEYDTRSRWQTLAGAEYTLNKQLSLIAQWHSDFGFGAGVSSRF